MTRKLLFFPLLSAFAITACSRPAPTSESTQSTTPVATTTATPTTVTTTAAPAVATENGTADKPMHPSKTASAPAKPISEEAEPPLYLEVHGPTAVVPNTDLDFTVDIVRSTANGAPMTLVVTVPSGAQLRKGAPKEVISDPSTPTVSRTFTLHLGASIPSADVLVTVDSVNANTGVHATGAYRFGRSAPTQPTLVPSGKSLSAKGIPLGKAIPVSN